MERFEVCPVEVQQYPAVIQTQSIALLQIAPFWQAQYQGQQAGPVSESIELGVKMVECPT